MGSEETTAIAERREANVVVVRDENPMLNADKFELMQRVSTAMAASSLIPEHLRGKTERETVGNCFMVVNQAFRWGMDPFSVAPESYVVRGKLAFQGKLVAGIVNSKGNLDGRLRYEFTGTAESLKVTVSGTIRGESEPRTVEVELKQAKTKNEMWRTDPEQKLCYNGAIKWARRHMPELMLGVMTDDDLERIAESRARNSGESLKKLEARLVQKSEDEPLEEVGHTTPAEEATHPPATTQDAPPQGQKGGLFDDEPVEPSPFEVHSVAIRDYLESNDAAGARKYFVEVAATDQLLSDAEKQKLQKILES